MEKMLSKCGECAGCSLQGSRCPKVNIKGRWARRILFYVLLGAAIFVIGVAGGVVGHVLGCFAEGHAPVHQNVEENH